MPKATSPSGSFVIVDDPFTLIRPPGATPMVPSLVIAVEVVLPRPTVPFTVRVPVFMIGPSRVSPGSPVVPEGSTVSDPSFSSSEQHGQAPPPPPPPPPKKKNAVVVVLVELDPDGEAAAGRHRELADGERPGAQEHVRVARDADIGARTCSGTPAVQLAAESPSAAPLPPVQVSLQLSFFDPRCTARDHGGGVEGDRRPRHDQEASDDGIRAFRQDVAGAGALDFEDRYCDVPRCTPRVLATASAQLVHPFRAPSVILSAAPAWR